MKKYFNYHKHDHISNIFTPDTHSKPQSYIDRAKQLDHEWYSTCNHGSGGDIFESKDLCEKNNLKCIFVIEGYIVKDPLEKDNRNYHIILIPKTNIARKKLNLITSRANVEGFYYKPRIFLSDLLSLDKDDLYISTACMAGIIRDDDSINDIFLPLINHFGRNVFLEVQNHNHEEQKRINKLCLDFANKYNLELVAANDSHYIYPWESKDRLEFLKGKGINYGDEDSFLLDYPDYDEMFRRFQEQGVLNNGDIARAMDNTLLFTECEEIYLDKSIKMPTCYPNLSADEKIVELKKHIAKKFKEICKEENINGEKLNEYKKGIQYEMQIIEDTKELNTADYFLLNEQIVDLAVHKYDGVLTRSGRGSCGAFYINRILGMTQIDRFNSPIKLYPERFISTARLLENKSIPDIDYNVASQEPFVKATKDILGKHCIYPMVAYGTMQIGEAFRNVCRSYGMPFEEFNEVGKNIEQYKNDNKWKKYIDECEKYIDVIVSASIHPCAYALENKDLRKEYGIVKIGKELCVMVTSGEADYWKLLKDDFLIVSVWGIISNTFNLIGKPILTVNELFNNLDERVWDIYKNGITCTLNQVDSDYATALMKRYKAHSVRDMAQFTAAVRPSFDSWREDFIERRPFSTGSPQLDEVLSETEGRITFQETLMTYFQWLGVTPAESIGLIKKISKKKIKEDDFKNLEDRIKAKWIKNTGSIDKFQETWEMVQSCMAYGFAAPHALATAIDSLYGAWLKVNYPLEYYTVAFGYYENDEERTKKLTEELKYFNIKLSDVKFRQSTDRYICDKKTNTIYKSVSSIKFLNSQVAQELYELRNKQYSNFIELLYDISNTSTNSRQLEILIKIGFFSEFGHCNALMKAVEVFNELYKCKTLKKEKIEKLGLDIKIVEKHCGKITEKTFSQINNQDLILDVLKNTKMPKTTIYDMMSNQIKYLGGTTLTNNNADVTTWIVSNVETMGYGTTYIYLYSPLYGATRRYKTNKTYWKNHQLEKGDIIQAVFQEKDKWGRNADGDFIRTGEKETILKVWNKIK